jgi:hypothetical protein
MAVGAVLAAGVTVSTADAATPTEGSVSDTSTTATWSGGPFPAPNTTGTALDQPNCDVPQSCDDFTLHVSTPAGYGTDHDLVIKVGWTNTAADFDVYLLDAQGNTVASAASSADPEQIIVPPTSGDYTVRVVPFAPLAETYDATATLAAKPANPAPGTDTPPDFTNYAAPSSFADANDAGEPSIGNNWKTGATMYQAGLSTFKAQFDDSVTPAKATWSDVSASAATGCPQGSTLSLDPILFTDHETGRTFESQLSGADSLTCWTDDDGQTWHPSQGGGIPSGADHQSRLRARAASESPISRGFSISGFSPSVCSLEKAVGGLTPWRARISGGGWFRGALGGNWSVSMCWAMRLRNSRWKSRRRSMRCSTSAFGKASAFSTSG